MVEVDSNTLLKEADDFFLQGDFSDEEHSKEVLKIYKNLADKEENSDAMYKYAYILYDLYEVDENKKMKEEAIKYFKMAIEKGNTNAMYHYAECIYDINEKEAVECFKMAIEKGNAGAMNTYAFILEDRDNNMEEAEKYYKMAEKYYKIGIENGNKNAMREYYNMISSGKITVNDEEKAKYCKMAADSGNKNAMREYYNMISSGKITVSNEEKAKYYKMAADIGNKNAMIEYYNMISNGKVTVSDEEKIKYCKMAADIENEDAISNYADMLYDGYGISENKQEAAEYYKIIVKYGNKNAIEKLYNMISNNIINVTNKEKEIYYKIAIQNKNKDAIEKLNNVVSNIDTTVSNEEKAIYYKIAADIGNKDAINEYYNMISNRKVTVNDEEKVKYYKLAADIGNKDAIKEYYKIRIDNGNIDFISNRIPDKQVFTKLFEEYSEKIIKILEKNKKEYELTKDENGKIKLIEIKKNIYDFLTQGENQVITNRKINFDKNGNLINIIDAAIHKDTGKKLYEVGYDEEGERLITYFDPENGMELITATIDENGIIKFNFDNGVDFETLKQKTNEILNSFDNNESFDDILSYLKYTPLQLMCKKEIEEDKIEFNTKCENYFDNTLNIINSSFDEKNKDKIFVCDFGYRGHCVQLLICNGEVTVINTGKRFDDKTEKIDVITEIKTKFAERFPEKVESLKITESSEIKKEKKEMKITESVVINQSVGNCVIASKIDFVEFLIKVKKHNQKYKRLIEINNRIIKIKEDIKNSKEYDENEYQKLIEEKRKLSKNKDKMIFSSPKDINIKLREELEKEIEIAQSEIIEQSKIPEYLNDINLFAKGEKKFKELQEKHFILLRKRIKTALSVHKNHLKHFDNISKEMKNIISKILDKKEISNEGIKKQVLLLKETFENINKELEQRQSITRSTQHK